MLETFALLVYVMWRTKLLSSSSLTSCVVSWELWLILVRVVSFLTARAEIILLWLRGVPFYAVEEREAGVDGY